MLTYEKALELKNAGFPQGEHVELSVPRLGIQEVSGSYVKIPTLSELIEECDKQCSNFALFSFGNWVCGDYLAYESDWLVRVEGLTPEEAVCNLWLELNKK